MIAANYSTVRENFKEYCDRANNDVETIFVTRKSGGNVVILSEAEYNNMIENLYIRSNKANYDRLTKSIERLNQGKGIKKELMND
ncbi:type II toxin-antitoxin system Phd/YefM family antitoxin [Sporomusa termitida]|uniref:Antitoxin n=1 Tax=Sporomusa termitida TaxID=2377 RepID=A0A517DVC0_9FIRM|nr:type II toxin-antitoxin system prevent-host-death family antitoxin [Sporomusa termitida]QDR81283.1 Antitoxin YefM [Sporomusa termitida]